MAVSVAAVMRQCRNFFQTGYVDGTFSITGNRLPVDDAPWVYVSGSAYHDGVWKLADGYLTGRDVDGLPDETFTGRVWILNPPADFLDLCAEIVDYEKKNPLGAYVSESFGAYSYTRNYRAGMDQSWAAMFSAQLAPYRKMYTEVQ